MRSAPKLALLWTLAALWLGDVARADSLESTFARGNAAFARADYEGAVREFEALIEAGVDDPDLAYNLASSYGALGRYGQAIRYFERALSEEPRADDAKLGLKLSREALGERQAEARGEALVVQRPPLSEAVFALFSADALALALLLTIWLGTVLWLILPRLATEALRLGAGIATALSFVLALFALLGVWTKADWGREGRRAIIVREAVPLRDGPDDRARMAGELAEGESVRLLSREGGFARISAGPGREGYVRAADVGEI